MIEDFVLWGKCRPPRIRPWILRSESRSFEVTLERCRNLRKFCSRAWLSHFFLADLIVIMLKFSFPLICLLCLFQLFLNLVVGRMVGVITSKLLDTRLFRLKPWLPFAYRSYLSHPLYFETQYFLFNLLSMFLLECKFHESRSWVEYGDGDITGTLA